MKNPEYNDAVTPYSKADRVIIKASLNQSRLDNKKGSAKKAVKPVAKKAAAPKPKSGAGSMAYTPGSAKNNKSTYTTGSGVSSKTSTPKAAPAQKTKPRFGGFSMLASGLTKKQNTSTAAYKADQAKMKAKFDAARAAKGKK